MSNMLKSMILEMMAALTAKGSACSQVMADPHVAFLAASGRDSGRTSTMKRMLNIVMSVASMTTWF